MSEVATFVAGPDFERQTILLAEDNDDDVLIMRSAFERAAIANPLQVVNDGEQVLEYLAGQGAYADRSQFPLPIILLLDLKMPKQGGLEALEWLRQQPTFKCLTVHILTASSRAADVQRAGELGANAYLIKPSRFNDLVEMLKAWHTLAKFQALLQAGALHASAPVLKPQT